MIAAALLWAKPFLEWIGKVLSAIPWQVYASIALLLSLYLTYRIGIGVERDRCELYKKEQAAKVAAVEERAKRREATLKSEMKDVELAYQEKLKNAQVKADLLTAQLDAGTIQLRKHWRGCPSGVPTSQGSSGADEDAKLRSASAGRIVGTVASCEAQVIALQDILRKEREVYREQP